MAQVVDLTGEDVLALAGKIKEGEILLKVYKLSRRGTRGVITSVPLAWLFAHGVQVGDHVLMIQDAATKDLILRPLKSNGGAA